MTITSTDSAPHSAIGLASASHIAAGPALSSAAAASPVQVIDPVGSGASSRRGSTVTRYEFDTVSTQSKVLAGVLRTTVRPFLALWSTVPDLPWPMDVVDYAGALLPPISGTTCAPVHLQNCTAEWVRPRTRRTGRATSNRVRRADTDRVILYLHGGAFVVCGLRSHRRMTSRIARAAGSDVLSIDYRMMPKNPISNAVADGVDGYRYLLELGYRPEQIVIGGDSAGGYLAFMVALTLESQGLPKPAGIFTMSPLTDLDPTRKVEHPNATRCAVFPAGAVPALTRLADRVDARIVVDGERGPRVSPVDADLTTMPPTLIQVGSTEMVLPDAELMAHRLSLAGVDCELQVWKNQVHVFQAADFVPESQRAIDEIAAFVDSVVTDRAAARTRSSAKTRSTTQTRSTATISERVGK